MGRYLCRHSPGVCVHWNYTLSARCLASRSFERRPNWGNIYTSFDNLQKDE